MPKVSPAHRAAVRDRILDAAHAVALREGLSEMSMADIISESGMSAGAIYGYFDNKEALVGQVAERVMAGRVVALEALAHERPLPTPAQVLRRLIDGMPTDLVDSGLVLQIWGAAGSGGPMREVAQRAVAVMGAGFEAYLVEWFVSRGVGRRTAESRAAVRAPAIIGLAQGYLVHRAVLGAESADRYLVAVDALLADV